MGESCSVHENPSCHVSCVGRTKAPVPNAWWRDHPAYEDLLAIFKAARINNGGHLAWVVLTGLRDKGMDVRFMEESVEYPGYDEETGYCLCGCCRHGV